MTRSETARGDTRRAAPTALEIHDLVYRYPGASGTALDVPELTIARGERVAILGPNGAGKTTLLLHLNGILEPTSGSVRVCGLDVRRENCTEVRRRVGLVFQDPDDQLFMPTLLEDVAFGPLCQGATRAEARARAIRALQQVGLGQLDPQQPAHHLSGGEKRRAALATILSMSPEILALDEPAAGLDARGRRRIARLLRAVPGSLILVTHDVEFATAVCRRAVILDGGRPIVELATAELLREPELLERHGLELPGALLREMSPGARVGSPGGLRLRGLATVRCPS